MINLEDEITAEVEMALANSKRAMRELRIVVQDLARLRDRIQGESDSK